MVFIPSAYDDYYTLSNGVRIPPLALGTARMKNDDSTAELVAEALEAGYRHFDTASSYHNEKAVGEGIRASGVPREAVFVTTKLDDSSHSERAARLALRMSLDKLDTEYIDLWLIHSPVPRTDPDRWAEANAETWAFFEEALEMGLARSIGVSNFLPRHLDQLLETAKIVPMVNQIKLSPGVTQPEVVDYCRGQGILLESYSPLDVGRLLHVPEIKRLAAKYGRTEAQVVLRWHIQQGFLALPKASSLKRIEENITIFDFELTEEDMGLLSGLTKHAKQPRGPIV